MNEREKRRELGGILERNRKATSSGLFRLIFVSFLHTSRAYSVIWQPADCKYSQGTRWDGGDLRLFVFGPPSPACFNATDELPLSEGVLLQCYLTDEDLG